MIIMLHFGENCQVIRHWDKYPFFDKIGENASPYGAGGLASRKPEKNKCSKKATLKTFFLLLLYSLYSFGIKPVRQGWRTETNKRGVKKFSCNVLAVTDVWAGI